MAVACPDRDCWRLRVVIGALTPSQQLCVGRLLKSQPDMDVVGPITDIIELMIMVREIDADAVILPLHQDGGEPGVCSHLLTEFPGLLVLAISFAGEQLFLLDQTISRTEIADQLEVMADIIRLVKTGE